MGEGGGGQFIISSETLKNWTKYMKPWYPRHWTSGNETEIPEKWETNEASTVISPK